MPDYRTIIIKRYALNLSGREIAKQIGASKSGVNEFLRAFDECNAIRGFFLRRADNVWGSTGLGGYDLNFNAADVHPSWGTDNRWNGFSLRWFLPRRVSIF